MDIAYLGVSGKTVFVAKGPSSRHWIPPETVDRSLLLQRLQSESQGLTRLPCPYAAIVQWMGAQGLTFESFTSEDLARLLQACFYYL
jgi:hypothetical protein